jgi:hypothetical protein
MGALVKSINNPASLALARRDAQKTIKVGIINLSVNILSYKSPVRITYHHIMQAIQAHGASIQNVLQQASCQAGECSITGAAQQAETGNQYHQCIRLDARNSAEREVR